MFSESEAGTFYRTTKIHKHSMNGNLSDLPSQSTVSNTNISTYTLAKLFWRLLSTLFQSDRIRRSTKDFAQNIKRENIPTDYI